VHYTEKLAAFVNTLSRLMTISDVAEITALSWDTVKNIVKERLQKDYGRLSFKHLKHLSIDEIYVGRRKKFYTLVLDLESGRIVWVRAGRGKAALQGFWRQLRLSKAKLEAVAMDMSGAYWAAVLEAFPKVKVVFDRFHVVKLMNEKLDDLRRALVREAQGPLKMAIKGVRFLLLARPRPTSKRSRCPSWKRPCNSTNRYFRPGISKRNSLCCGNNPRTGPWNDSCGNGANRRWPLGSSNSSRWPKLYWHIEPGCSAGGFIGSTTAKWKGQTTKSRPLPGKRTAIGMRTSLS
jgi:hypothetical protein